MRRGLKIVVDHKLTPLEMNFDSVETIQIVYNNNTNTLYEYIVYVCRYFMKNPKNHQDEPCVS